jgi:hypothetical protein
MVEPVWSEAPTSEDLPGYLSEPPAASPSLGQWREDLSRAIQREATALRATGALAVPFVAVTPRPSLTFSRLAVLHRDLLPSALDAWWTAGEKAGAVRVHRRLQLTSPQGGPGVGWRMHGRVRRLTSPRSIPVVVELWPKYDDFTVMTMTPQRSVLATRLYFRLGHAVLDRLRAELEAWELSNPPAG